MSKKLLTREQIKKLQENLYVKSATPRVINFTPEFKKWAYGQLSYGKPISQIFEEAGFDIAVIGNKRMENFRARLEKSAEREAGFADLRSNNHRQEAKSTEAQLEKRLRQLEHQVAYLQQENEFLKKIQEAKETEASKCRRT